MALTLLQAETQVRELERHDVDERVTQAQIRVWLHHEYRELRRWLQDFAPSLYLVCSTEVPIAAGEELQLTSAESTFERLYRVEFKVGDVWRPMERASEVDVNNHVAGRYTFREEAGCLKFGPDDLFAGTVRVKYYGTPPTLEEDDDVFNIPVALETPLIVRTCGWLGWRDGEGVETLELAYAKADVMLYGVGGTAARPRPGSAAALFKQRHGVHPQSSGLRRVLGY